ncbi:hypothetical protein [Kitasatospora aureofaciens]|uniref:hypothetical protein n=1 Tax=Kitasatospora aureofaciens TaxID=1894 RepID=UPI0036F453C4
MNDPAVFDEVTEQVRDALISAPVIGWFGESNYDTAARYAASTALHEIADMLRERAHEIYGPAGRHEVARALLVEADRLASEERSRPGQPPRR